MKRETKNKQNAGKPVITWEDVKAVRELIKKTDPHFYADRAKQPEAQESYSLTREAADKIQQEIFRSLSLVRLSSYKAADLGTVSDEILDINLALGIVEDRLKEALRLLDI